MDHAPIWIIAGVIIVVFILLVMNLISSILREKRLQENLNRFRQAMARAPAMPDEDDRKVYRTEDLPQEIIDALSKVKMDSKHDYLNAELDGSIVDKRPRC